MINNSNQNQTEWTKKTSFSLLEKKVIKYLENKYIRIKEEDILNYYKKNKSKFKVNKKFHLKIYNFELSEIETAKKALDALRNKYSDQHLLKNKLINAESIQKISVKSIKDSPWKLLGSKRKGSFTDIIKTEIGLQIVQLTGNTKEKIMPIKMAREIVVSELISAKNLNYEKLMKEELGIEIKIHTHNLNKYNLQNWRFK